MPDFWINPGTAATNDVRLLPVVVHGAPAQEQEEAASPAASLTGASAAAVHIEFPGHAFVSVVGSADPGVIRAVLESLCG
jgi:hypothetical protein